MNQLYKFYNRNASSIRSIIVANCPWLEYSENSKYIKMYFIIQQFDLFSFYLNN